MPVECLAAPPPPPKSRAPIEVAALPVQALSAPPVRPSVPATAAALPAENLAMPPQAPVTVSVAALDETPELHRYLEKLPAMPDVRRRMTRNLLASLLPLSAAAAQFGSEVLGEVPLLVETLKTESDALAALEVGDFLATGLQAAHPQARHGFLAGLTSMSRELTHPHFDWAARARLLLLECQRRENRAGALAERAAQTEEKLLASLAAASVLVENTSDCPPVRELGRRRDVLAASVQMLALAQKSAEQLGFQAKTAREKLEEFTTLTLPALELARVGR